MIGYVVAQFEALGYHSWAHRVVSSAGPSRPSLSPLHLLLLLSIIPDPIDCFPLAFCSCVPDCCANKKGL